jgi:hypothetical protein
MRNTHDGVHRAAEVLQLCFCAPARSRKWIPIPRPCDTPVVYTDHILHGRVGDVQKSMKNECKHLIYAGQTAHPAPAHPPAGNGGRRTLIGLALDRPLVFRLPAFCKDRRPRSGIMLLLISLPACHAPTALAISCHQNALPPLITPLLTDKLPATSVDVCLCDGRVAVARYNPSGLCHPTGTCRHRFINCPSHADH